MYCTLSRDGVLQYESHDMRHTGFHRLTVVNGTPGFWGFTFFVIKTLTRGTLRLTLMFLAVVFHPDGNLNLLEHESIKQYFSISIYKRSVDYLYNCLGMDTLYRR